MKFQIDTTQERDIDLLIIEEFVSDKNFARIFLEAAEIKGEYEVERVIHSKIDAEFGESDVVIILNVNQKRHALHIEDKIDAIAMPMQHDRYDMRAAKDIAAGEYDSYTVLIVAPEKYLETNKEAQKYEHQVKYEQMREHFAASCDVRSQYKLALIDRAIFEQKNGYQWEANPGVVSFCTAMNEYRKAKYPSLPDISESWWPEFPTMIKKVKVVFKADKGFCDLQFGKTTAEELCLKTQGMLSENMDVVRANKSASIRIKVTPIDMKDEFANKVSEVEQALEAMWTLYDLSKRIAVESCTV